MKVDLKSGCLICGDELVYANTSHEQKCMYCGKIETSNIYCPNTHYICNACHSKTANELIEDYCIHTQEKNPVTIFTYLAQNPAIKMHGPEHHFLVPAALLAAYYNTTGETQVKSSKIKSARKRGEMVPGGFCGTHGNCGAAVGAGIFMSLITNSTSLALKEWQLSNLLTAKCLEKIALSGGPRCCKRDTFIAFSITQAFLQEHLHVETQISDTIKCEFSSLNKQCIGKACDYFVE